MCAFKFLWKIEIPNLTKQCEGLFVSQYCTTQFGTLFKQFVCVQPHNNTTIIIIIIIIIIVSTVL